MKLKITIIILFINFFLYSQEIVNCKKGKSFWVIENGKNIYSIELKGKINKTENSKLIVLNDIPLQNLIVEKNKFTNDKNKDDNFSVLKEYVEGENKYLNSKFKTELEIKMFKVELENNITSLFWFFTMPENINKEVKSQLFVSMILDDKIFGLSSTQFIGQNFENLQNLLLDTIYSVKIIDSEKKICE